MLNCTLFWHAYIGIIEVSGTALLQMLPGPLLPWVLMAVRVSYLSQIDIFGNYRDTLNYITIVN